MATITRRLGRVRSVRVYAPKGAKYVKVRRLGRASARVSFSKTRGFKRR